MLEQQNIKVVQRCIWSYCYLDQTHLDSSFFRWKTPSAAPPQSLQSLYCGARRMFRLATTWHGRMHLQIGILNVPWYFMPSTNLFAKAVVRSDRVVVATPGFDLAPRGEQVAELARVQTFLAQLPKLERHNSWLKPALNTEHCCPQHGSRAISRRSSSSTEPASLAGIKRTYS